MRSRVLLLVSLGSAAFAFACGGGGSSDDGSAATPGPVAVTGGHAGASAGGGAQGGKSGASGSTATGGSGAKAGASGSGGVAGTAGKGGGAGGSKAGAGGSSGTTGTGGKGGNGGTGTGGKAGSGGSGTSGAGTGGSAACTPIALSITPSVAMVTVVNGVANPVTFSAKGICPDNSMIDVSPTWTFDRLDIATIGPGSGILQPVGTKGGTGTVTATTAGLTGQAEADIVLQVSDAGGIDPGTQGMLDNPPASGPPGVSIVYPYDRTVFARGILAPELMWNGGQPGDAYLVHIQEQYMDVKLYLTADPPSREQMSDAVWNALTATNAGEDVSVDVVRFSGGVVYPSAHESWKVAQGSLRGNIYYWAVNEGQIVKIAPGASSPTVVFDSGPIDQLGTPAPAGYDGTMPPWQDDGTGKRCVACHVVSKDGSTLASVFSTPRGSTGPWGSVNLSTGTITALSNYLENTTFEALSPDGKFVVANTGNMRMHLADSATGNNIGSALDAIGDNTCDPAFSHDGTKLAFAGNVQGYYPVEFYASTLDLLDFSGGNFGNRRTVVNGGGQAIAFPSFSPGSDMVVYQRGDYSRAKYGNNQHGSDDLYLTDLAGKLGEVPLDAANGAGVLDAKNQHLNYQPTVNPIAVGGYFWVVFVSPRDYGNRMVSTSDPTYENHKQLWVAAVDLNPSPGQDPSHPAFLLRGQDLTTTNMSGYWSLEACHQTGTQCNEGYECCSGYCEQDANGQFSCVSMPSGGCSSTGEKCATAADCCSDPMGVDCIGGFCSKGKP